MTDYEIAKSKVLRPIKDIATELQISEDELTYYGKYIAKISPREAGPRSKLILVTATSPTKYGEGKTTVSIGIIDGIKRLGGSVCGALREPSLGPVFGIKGGATGGGQSQIAPMDDINLHFTGDFHAITTATNLLAAIIDNSIFHGNPLNIDPEKVVFTRCLDINDRALRSVELTNRKDSFTLTAASEIMATLCLATDENDLQERLGDILIGYTFEGEEVHCRDLKAVGALMVILKDAVKPNLVQTLEGNPVIIHGGPFANIAHGCNSVIATNTALGLANYVVTEAGFGADLGAEKFLDIKCRELGRAPNCVVLVTSLRSIKYNAGDASLSNIEALRKGSENLVRHYQNLVIKHGVVTIVAVNRFQSDTEEELEELKKIFASNGVIYKEANGHAQGAEGMEALAGACMVMSHRSDPAEPYIYSLDDSPAEKIYKIASELYGAAAVEFSDTAKSKIEKLKGEYLKYPVCVAKTQYSFSDNSKLLGAPENHVLHVDDILIRRGPRFLVAVCGGMMLMPGLPKSPASENMEYENGDITGLF